MVMLLVFISSIFFGTCVESRTHHHKKHPKHSNISQPPTGAYPPSEPPEPISDGSNSSSTNSTGLIPPPSPSPSPIGDGTGGDSSNSSVIYDVRAYGAVGDGVCDDTEAFKNAWDSACESGSATVLAPKGYTFIIHSTIFTGPCQSGLIFQVLIELNLSEFLLFFFYMFDEVTTRW